MTEGLAIAQTDLLCVSCAGQCVYDPPSGTLTCTRCASGHAIPVDPDIDPTVEHDFDPDLPQDIHARFTRQRAYQCETCGGAVVFQGHSITETCPYCEGTLVERAKDESYRIRGLIPFSISIQQAQENAQAWVRGRWAAPSDLPTVVAECRVAGIYVPFWTFDSTEAVQYTVTYRAKQGKRTITRSVSGSMQTAFDDLLMPASPHVTPLIRDGILHEFDPNSLRPFEPAYLAGFAAELHHQTVTEGLRANEPDKALLLRNRIKKHSGKRNISSVNYTTDTTGIRYRRILLPVWILHYTYDGKPMKVVTCGLHGRTFGERPFSNSKLLGLAALAAAGMSAFGFWWGAMGFY